MELHYKPRDKESPWPAMREVNTLDPRVIRHLRTKVLNFRFADWKWGCFARIPLL
jgi:hypothetical protein